MIGHEDGGRHSNGAFQVTLSWVGERYLNDLNGLMRYLCFRTLVDGWSNFSISRETCSIHSRMLSICH